MGASILALTMGEPAGIGPEIAGKAWRCRREGVPAFVFLGSAAALAAHGFNGPVARVHSPAEAEAAFPDALPVLEHPLGGQVRPGVPCPETAPAVVASIEQAAACALEGTVLGIVTGPIHKHTLYEAGFHAPGHTEFLARLAGRSPGDAVMMLAASGLRVVPLTVHVPLAEVPAMITMERIRHVARIVHEALARDFGLVRPRLAVAGLNPHAGEEGAIGDEDERVIRPAIEELRCEGLDIRGPLAADTLFHVEARAGYDAALCMYHDQALIPLKTLDFWGGVNITLGLPFVRTSPDHGTALDIAGRGMARADSLIAALKTAQSLGRRRFGRA